MSGGTAASAQATLAAAARDPALFRLLTDPFVRPKSRFTTLILRETLENDIQNPCANAVDASWPLSPEATKHLLPSGRYPYADPFSTGWNRTSLPGSLVITSKHSA